jgi:hypothetical protein
MGLRGELAGKRFARLPLGSIRPRGWLLEQLRLSATGLTGRMPEIWPDVGAENAWLGGSGENWERGPYYARGLLSLAHALGDEALISQARRWIDWSLDNQSEDGSFGPGDRFDWWPRMPMMEALRLHFSATADPRVPTFLSRYFRYQRQHLAEHPLTFWAKPRGGDNLESVLWLYDHSGEGSLLDLARCLHAQTSDWVGELGSSERPKEEFDFGHGVNRAMGLKEPALWSRVSQQHSDLAAVRNGWTKTLVHHGQIQGTFSGDEFLHGPGSTQGTEFCTIVELLSTLQTIIEVGGGMWAADAMERIAYNALPAILSADHHGHQYFQLPNQIQCTPGTGNFWVPHGNDLLFGPATGYGCCAANFHMGWPHLAHHLWYATADGGLAAVLFASSSVTATVAQGRRITIEQHTDYPFDTDVRLVVHTAEPVTFPLCVRVPGWATSYALWINDEAVDPASPETAGSGATVPEDDGLLRIRRGWKDGDSVLLRFPMAVRVSREERSSAGLHVGPLVFALPVGEDWRAVAGEAPFCDYELYPKSPWNYALLLGGTDSEWPPRLQRAEVAKQPWSAARAPLRLHVRGRRLPGWTAANGTSGPIPEPPIDTDAVVESLELVPFGCARLRISMFPVLNE